MKKKIIFLLTFLIATLAFGNTYYSSYKENEILEEKLEREFNYNYRVLSDGIQKLMVEEYDIDILKNCIEIDIEVKTKLKNFDYEEAVLPLKEKVYQELGDRKPSISIIIEKDNSNTPDEILYKANY